MHIIARMNVGGPAVEITELMRGLDPQIISQRLVTGFCNDDEADFLTTQAPDISVSRIAGFGKRIKTTDDIRTLMTLIRLIRVSRPDVVHTHTAKAGVLGRIAAKVSGTGVKVIHTYHGHLLHGYFGPSGTRAVTQIERQLADITDRMITVGDKVRDDLLKAGIGRPDQYTVIRSGVNLGPLPDQQCARRELGLPENAAIVSMVGRLTRIKRLDRFAEAVAITSARGLNVHYVVAGGGEHAKLLRQRVDRHRLPVTMLGWRSDLETILAASDIALLTSDNEGMPLSLLQAAYAGIPVIATRVGSVPEIVISGETGVLVPPLAREIANAIEYLCINPDLRICLGRQARDLAVRRWSSVNFLDEHKQIYELVLEATRG